MTRWQFQTSDRLVDSYRHHELWGTKSILDCFKEALRRSPQREAVVDYSKGERRSVTYQQLDRVRRQWANLFISLGVKRGEVISFQLPNRWEFVGAYLACETMGAIANPLMPIFRELELRTMLSIADTRLLIVSKNFRNFDHEAMGIALQGNLPSLKRVLTIEQLLTQGEDQAVEGEWKSAQPDDVVELLFTPGTTGIPKGVMHTGNTLLSALGTLISTLDLTEKEVMFMGAPVGHQTGFLYGVLLPLVLGGTSILQDIWEARPAAAILVSEKVTITMASTPFLTDLADAELLATHDLKNLRLFLCGGASIPRSLVENASRLMSAKILSLWGMSECGIATMVLPTDPAERAYSTDGKPLPTYEISTVTAHGEPVPKGHEGEILVRGPSCAVGYLEHPELFDMDQQGWFKTGDIGVIDERGYLRISDRSKDIIIRGGENIPVVEVELQLSNHPSVQEVAIVGMPDERLGERGCAFVVAHAGGFTLGDMREHLQSVGMAKNYWPEHVELVSTLPKTPAGKVQKYQLRARAKELSLGSKQTGVDSKR